MYDSVFGECLLERTVILSRLYTEIVSERPNYDSKVRLEPSMFCSGVKYSNHWSTRPFTSVTSQQPFCPFVNFQTPTALMTPRCFLIYHRCWHILYMRSLVILGSGYPYSEYEMCIKQPSALWLFVF